MSEETGRGAGPGAAHGADREGQVSASFVHLATALATGADVVELLSVLTADCARLLDVASAGLLLADGAGVLHVMAASSEATRDLELFQLQREQGPCRDCYRSGAPVSVPDVGEQAQRWPAFAAAASRAGFASVHAVPMRLRDQVLGTLGLFGTRAGVLDPRDVTLAQALADVASVAIVQNAPAAPVSAVASVSTQLQAALDARVVVEQAKGLLAHAGHLSVQDASARLRSYAQEAGLPLSRVADDVVHRRLRARAVLALPSRRLTGGA